jgi:hypothetical protein
MINVIFRGKMGLIAINPLILFKRLFPSEFFALLCG